VIQAQAREGNPEIKFQILAKKLQIPRHTDAKKLQMPFQAFANKLPIQLKTDGRTFLHTQINPKISATHSSTIKITFKTLGVKMKEHIFPSEIKTNRNNFPKGLKKIEKNTIKSL
jgi:hypothetical protein